MAITAAQTPIFCGIGASLNVELKESVDPDSVRDELESAPGLVVMDDPENEIFPDTLEAMANEEALIGRIRQDPSNDRAVQIWVSLDNLRAGSALNMVRIAEHLNQTV